MFLVCKAANKTLNLHVFKKNSEEIKICHNVHDLSDCFFPQQPRVHSLKNKQTSETTICVSRNKDQFLLTKVFLVSSTTLKMNSV